MKKIVFAAIIGYTGVETNDQRVLEAPEADDRGRRPLSHRPFPLIIRAPHNGGVVKIGEIEAAALCDRRIIAFGHLDPDEEFDHIIRSLDHGTYHLEIDVDQVKIAYDHGVTRMTEWRLVGAMIGMNPCWALPRTQIEILNAKEMSSA